MDKEYKFLTLILAIVFFTCLVACTNDSNKGGDTTISEGLATNSVEDWTSKIAETPESGLLYAKRGAVYYERGAFDEAIADFKRAIALDSTEVQLHHELANVYLDYNKSQLALETLENISNRYPERIPTLLKLSEFQLIVRKNEDSFRTLDRIFKLDPQNAEAFFMLGLNFKDVGDEQRAINSFQSAVENNPDLIDGWIELGYLLEKAKNPIADKYFDNALRIDSMNTIALEAKGNYLVGQEKYKEAIVYYRKINRINPQNPNAYYNIGLAYLQLDSIVQAQRNLNIAIKVDPVYLMGYFYRAYIAELTGDIEAAKQDYQQVLRLDPKFERATEALARLK